MMPVLLVEVEFLDGTMKHRTCSNDRSIHFIRSELAEFQRVIANIEVCLSTWYDDGEHIENSLGDIRCAFAEVSFMDCEASLGGTVGLGTWVF